MKKLITFFALIAIVVINVSCVHEEQELNIKSSDVLIEKGILLASFHNECLEKVYTDYINSLTRSMTDSPNLVKNQIVLSINNLINEKLFTRSESDYVNYDDYNSTSINEIIATVSEHEMQYINRSITAEPESLSQILNEVSTDSILNVSQKQAVISFIATFDLSSEYWESHYQEWGDIFKIAETRAIEATIQDIAFADAWWAYQGAMSSGFNVYVAGGAAALASITTAIYG